MQIQKDLLELRQKEKRITSEILDKLQMMEDCKGYLGLGYPSFFDYLVRGLGYSEATAYQRQACVRLAREVPEIKTKIDEGHLSVTAVSMAYKHVRKMPAQQKKETLEKLENKSSRGVKKILAEPAQPIKIKKLNTLIKFISGSSSLTYRIKSLKGCGL